MDEPFAALDAQTKLEMQEELVAIWQKRRCTIVFVTHSVDEALVLGNKIGDDKAARPDPRSRRIPNCPTPAGHHQPGIQRCQAPHPGPDPGGVERLAQAS